MATANNINYAKLKEEERNNKETLEETKRSNKEKENTARRDLKEKERHNKEEENLKAADITVKGVSSLFGSAGPLMKTAINDPSWYNKDPNLVKDVASFSFGTPMGSTPDIIDDFVYFSSGATTRNEKQSRSGIPGVMVLNYTSTIPSKKVMKNIAEKFYAEVRRANSGSRNYEAVDLAMYLLAISEAYAQLTNAARLYSIANTYKNNNFYYAKAYLMALGCTSQFTGQLLNNLANYRSRLNILISRLNSFNLPNTFPLFARKVWLNSTIFKDHEVSRSSNYMFAPAFIYLFKEADFFTLQPKTLAYKVKLNNDESAVDAYLNQLSQLVDNLAYSEDIGIMSGDIAKAFPNSLIQMNRMDVDFKIDESYVPEVLSQINAATVVGPIDPATADIYTTSATDLNSYILMGNSTQKTEGLFTKDIMSSGSNDYLRLSNLHNIVNMYKNDVTPDDVMVATRLQCTYSAEKTFAENTYHDYRKISNYGSEIVSTVNIAFYGPINTAVTSYEDAAVRVIYDVFDGLNNRATSIISSVNVETSEVATYLNGFVSPGSVSYSSLIKAISSFDWAPRLRFASVITATTSQTSLPVYYDNKDFANYMVINSDRLNALHTVALMSMFNLF